MKNLLLILTFLLASFGSTFGQVQGNSGLEYKGSPITSLRIDSIFYKSSNNLLGDSVEFNWTGTISLNHLDVMDLKNGKIIRHFDNTQSTPVQYSTGSINNFQPKDTVLLYYSIKVDTFLLGSGLAQLEVTQTYMTIDNSYLFDLDSLYFEMVISDDGNGKTTSGYDVTASNSSNWTYEATGLSAGDTISFLVPQGQEFTVTVTDGNTKVDETYDSWNIDSMPETQNFEIESSTSRQELQNLQGTVHPNPTNGRVTIELDQHQAFEFTLFSMTGQALLNGQGNRAADVDVSHLPKGIYILRARTQDRQMTRKIVLK